MLKCRYDFFPEISENIDFQGVNQQSVKLFLHTPQWFGSAKSAEFFDRLSILHLEIAFFYIDDPFHTLKTHFFYHPFVFFIALAFSVHSLSVQRLAFSVQRLALGVQRLAFSAWRLAFSVQRIAFKLHTRQIGAQRLALSAQRLALSAQRLALSAQRLALSAQRYWRLAFERLALSAQRLALSFQFSKIFSKIFSKSFENMSKFVEKPIFRLRGVQK